jgi:hypothetical protein
MRYLGIPLAHTYSFNSSDRFATLPHKSLIAADRILADALLDRDISFKIVQAFTVEEYSVSNPELSFRIALYLWLGINQTHFFL